MNLSYVAQFREGLLRQTILPTNSHRDVKKKKSGVQALHVPGRHERHEQAIRWRPARQRIIRDQGRGDGEDLQGVRLGVNVS